MRPGDIAKRLLMLSGALLAAACGFGERGNVLILVRAGDPVSRSIGDYYAARRDIPSSRILELELPTSPDATEIDLASFDSHFGAPIESYLSERDPDGEISILVTTLGLPLRIRLGKCPSKHGSNPHDCPLIAVDAALAGLGRLSFDAGASAENVNPFFSDPRGFDDFRRDEPNAKLRFLVARMTSPRRPLEADTGLPSALRRLIDAPDSEGGEATPLWLLLSDLPTASRAPVTAALFDPAIDVLERSGHRVCDGCTIALEASPPIGIVLQSDHFDVPENSLPERLAFPGVVIALGGPIHRRDSKTSTADDFPASISRWLSRGARAVSTHIRDPSLSGVTRPALQLQDWAEGRPAIEAHFKSVPRLGWVNVFIGDPLLSLADASTIDAGDRDGDGVPDRSDNCLTVSNPRQRDSNADSIGNRCDPDVNGDGRVDTSWGQIYPLDARGDLEAIALTARNGPHNPDHDLDGNDLVDANDVALAQLWLFRRPGPSGVGQASRVAAD